MFDEQITLEHIWQTLHGIDGHTEFEGAIPVDLAFFVELTKAKLKIETLKTRLRNAGPFDIQDILIDMELMKEAK